MKEHDILGQIVSELRDATASNVDVRVSGGDEAPEPPEVILDWSTFRLDNHAGHRVLGRILRDSSGNAIGKEYHSYFRMEITCTVRYFDPVVRDQVINTIQMAFLPYEDNPKDFNSHTTEWDVGGGARSTNSIVERDWYEGNVLLQFQYVKKTGDTDDYDTIEDITVDVNPDESIEENTTETK